MFYITKNYLGYGDIHSIKPDDEDYIEIENIPSGEGSIVVDGDGSIYFSKMTMFDEEIKETIDERMKNLETILTTFQERFEKLEKIINLLSGGKLTDSQK